MEIMGLKGRVMETEAGRDEWDEAGWRDRADKGGRKWLKKNGAMI